MDKLAIPIPTVLKLIADIRSIVLSNPDKEAIEKIYMLIAKTEKTLIQKIES